MKYLKTFENIENVPQVGDWIIAKDAFDIDIVNDYLNNNIGLVYKKTYSNNDQYVKYFNIPTEIKHYFKDGDNNDTMFISKKEIFAFSSNKKELESILAAKKYNL